MVQFRLGLVGAVRQSAGLAIGFVDRSASEMMAKALHLGKVGNRRPHRALRRLAEIIETVGIGGLVLGLPVQMDGTEGRRCQSVRQSA